MYISALSIPFIGLHVAAPPSAVVKFFTAWNENEEKSAIAPQYFFSPLIMQLAPRLCAQSATIDTLPIDFCILLERSDRGLL